jgi:hypothetical protein
VKLRPKWSQIKGSTRACGSCARLLVAAALLVGCSALDPNIGPRRTEEGLVADAGESESGDLDDSGPPGTVSFKNDIRPLMDRPSSKTDPKGCKSCHYRTEANHTGLDLSGLDLTTLGMLRRGGGSSRSRIIVPGKPAESVLVQALKGTYFYSVRMPKNGPFWDDLEIELVETWIAEGAKGADGE